MPQNSVLFDEISDMLLDCDLFNHLPADEIRAASRHFGCSKLRKGETIFNEGDDGSFMCVVHEGRVSVIKTDQFGNPVVMGTEGAGHVIGEMAVLDGERRSASCVAASDCVLLTLSKEAMDTMLDEQPRLGAKILRAVAVSLSRRMRMAAGKLVDFAG
jgi:CRP-like cAMP-binding protein